MRRPFLLVILLFCGFLLGRIGPAFAEAYVSAFLGESFPTHQDLDASARVNGLTFFPGFRVSRSTTYDFTIPDAKFNHSLAYGGKVGYFFRWSWLGVNPGLEGEFTRFHPDLDRKTVNTSGTITAPPFGTFPARFNVTLQHSDLSTNVYAVNFLLRRPFKKSTRYPHGHFQLYAGPGVDLVHTSINSKPLLSMSGGTARDSDTEFGFQALGGGRIFLTRHFSLFGEYRFLKTGEFDFQEQQTVGGNFGPMTISSKLHVPLTANMFYGGLSFHF
jgi:opacity protein-like surface antigen